jgi:hypothetical protein
LGFVLQESWCRFIRNRDSPGGIFAASVKNIKKRKMEVWRAAERSLSRGDNIQEGHYMERTWAVLLASPLEEYQMKGIKSYSNLVLKRGYEGLYKTSEPFTGMLVRRKI